MIAGTKDFIQVGAWPIILALFGAGLLYRWWSSSARYTLVLVAGGGEIKALESTDTALIEQIRAAVATAISVR